MRQEAYILVKSFARVITIALGANTNLGGAILLLLKSIWRNSIAVSLISRIHSDRSKICALKDRKENRL